MRTQPTPEQTLRALDRVSRGLVWNATPQRDSWQHVADAAASLIHYPQEAAE